jgi:hypothetical protein
MWAKGNAEYAAKYDRPYPKQDARRYARMAKQAVDARHVDGMAGVYGTIAAAGETGAASGEIGAAYYPTSWLETRAGLAGLAGADSDPESLGDLLYLGVNGGARLGSPTRIAPFIGVGTFAGVSTYDVVAAALDDDDDDDLFDDPEDERLRLVGAVYPEVGLHVWVTDRLRLTGSAAYYVTTEGRDNDFWLFGLSVGRFTEPNFSEKSALESQSPIHWPTPEAAEDAVSRLPAP